MKIDSAYYEFTSKELRGLGSKAMDERFKVLQAFGKFAKKVGAKPKVYHCHSANDSMSILGFYFKKEPSKKLWRQRDKAGEPAYVPRRDTKEGRALYAEFKKLPSWNCNKLKEAVGYDIIFHQNYVYYFSWFFYESGLMGIKIPVFDNEAYKNDPKLKYKPVKGMKEISWKVHNIKSAMSSRAYLTTLR